MANEEAQHRYSGIGTYTLRQTTAGPGGQVLSTTKSVTVTGTTSSPPTVRAVSKLGNRTVGASSFTINNPAGTTNGDLLCLVVFQRASNPTIPAPTGWTARGSMTNIGNQVIFLFSKVFSTGGASSVTVSSSATTAVGGIMIAITAGTYLQTGNPFELLNGSVESIGNYPGSSSATWTVPSITTTVNNSLQFVAADFLIGVDTGGFILNSGDTATATSGASAGFTLTGKLDGASNAGATEIMLGTANGNLMGIVQHRTVTTAGATATATMRQTSSNAWMGLQWAVKAAQTIGPSPYTPRFAGDPGAGFTYMSWATEGFDYTEFKNEVTRMKGITYTGGSTNNSRNGVLFRYDSVDPFGSPFGSGSVGRTAVAEGRIPFVSWHWSYTDCLSYIQNDSTATTFVTNLISDLNATFTATPAGKVWLNLLYLPDRRQGLSEGFDTKAAREVGRQAQRKFVAALRAAAITRQKAAFVGPVLMSSTMADAATDYNNGVIKNDPWWEYHPDFKGYTKGSMAWKDGFSPEPADFQVLYSTVAGTQYRTVDIFGLQQYCWHSLGSNDKEPYMTKADPANNIWLWSSVPAGPYTPTVYEYHDLFTRGEANGNTATAGHAWAARKSLDYLYGKNTMGILLAEYAFPVAEFEARQFNGFPDVVATRDHWKHLAQEHADYGVVGSFYWQQDNNYATIDNDENVWALGFRFGQGFDTTVGGNVYDGGPVAITDLPSSTNGKDARRKGLAAQMDMTVQLNAIRTS